MSEDNRYAIADLTIGQLNAIVKKLGGADGAMRLLRGEVTVSAPTCVWRKEDDGTITLTVSSNGLTGEQWISRLEGKGLRVGDYAKSVLRSTEFNATSGVTHTLKVLPGHLYTDDQRVTSTIRADAKRRKLTIPNAEVACLLRDVLSDAEIEAMGLWALVVMHEPIKDSDRYPDLLFADRSDVGRWLGAYLGYPDFRWDRGHGFVFAAAQVGP